MTLSRIQLPASSCCCHSLCLMATLGGSRPPGRTENPKPRRAPGHRRRPELGLPASHATPTVVPLPLQETTFDGTRVHQEADASRRR